MVHNKNPYLKYYYKLFKLIFYNFFFNHKGTLRFPQSRYIGTKVYIQTPLCSFVIPFVFLCPPVPNGTFLPARLPVRPGHPGGNEFIRAGMTWSGGRVSGLIFIKFLDTDFSDDPQILN